MTDLALARAAEGAEVRAWSDLVEAAPPDLRERLGLAAIPVAGGVALVSSKVRSVLYNRVFGFGLAGPVDRREIHDAIARYRRDAPFTVQPTPFARPTGIGRWLDALGLRVYFNWVRWVRDASEPPEARSPVTLRRVEPREGGVLAELMIRIFDQPQALAPWVGLAVGRPGWTHYFACEGNEPVGTGALHVADGVGWLGWAGTLPSHRRRGIQQALLAQRIRDAREEGCAWLTVETAEDLADRPNPSYRNVARAGFRVLCLRPSFAHTPPDPSRVAAALPESGDSEGA